MGFFDFLTAPNNGDPKAKKPVAALPGGAVAEAEPTQLPFTLSESHAGSGSGRPSAPSPADAKRSTKPGLLGESDSKFLKERAKTRDLAFSEARNAIEMALSEIDSRDPGAGNPMDRKPFEARLRAAAPENYAKEVENILNELEPTVRGLGGTFDRNAILSNVENAVTNYRRLLATPQQSTDTQRLETQDRPNLQAQLDQKMKAIESITEKEKFAATERQRQQLAEERKFFVTEAAKLQQKVGASQVPAEATSQTPVTDYMDGLGIDRETLVDRIRESMKAVGIGQDKWEQPVDPRSGLLRVVGALDQNGSFAALLAGQLAKARAEDQASAATPRQDPGVKEASDGIARTEAKIQGREAEMKALYAQLAQSPFMHTWPGIILYVLVGMITQNPAFAARLIGGVGNREAIDREIKGIQYDLRRLDNELERREQDYRYQKQEAARRLQHREDRQAEWQHQIGMKLMEHKLIIERNQKRNNPETTLMKKLSSEFQRASTMAAKYAPTANNEFAPEAERQKAQANMNAWMRKMAQIDAQLGELGGDVLSEEPSE